MAAGSDVISGAGGGAAAGAAAGSVIPGIGTAIGAGIGALVGTLGGIGKWLFGRSEQKRAKREAERLAEEQKKRHQEFIEEAEKRTGELYEKYKFDPEALKNEYAASVKRALEQQAGGLTAALASQRHVNPALASHLLANQQVDVQARTAGETALNQAKLGAEFDIYNKQLMQNIRQQELTYEGKEENRQATYAEDAYKNEREMRQKMIDDIFGSVSKGIEGGAKISNIGRNTQQPQSTMSDLPARYSFTNPNVNPWEKYALINNPQYNLSGLAL